MERNGRHADEQGHDALARVRREGRWWWVQARHTRRIWRWALLAAAVLFVALVLMRRPLANWFWDEPRIQQLLAQGDRALADGRLSAPDGSGAREQYQAALALDGDRLPARQGLMRTGMAALRVGSAALERDDLDGAEQALVLARQLQVPQADSEALARGLRERRAQGAGLDAVVRQARRALDAGDLDGAAGSALPLVQRVLDLRPLDVQALEVREDALTDLLLRARLASDAGKLAQAAQLLASARAYDAGHADLPVTQEVLSRAIERRVEVASRTLRRGRLDAARDELQPALDAAGEEPAVLALRERLARAFLQESQRLSADYRFDRALSRVEVAEALLAPPREVASARARVERERSARQVAGRTQAGSASERRQLARLLEQLAEAEARGHLIAPPGASAYDALREAQAIAPQDRRVLSAARRLLPASQTCFEDALRQNRVEAAGACLQAWQALAPADAGVGTARNRLALRWVAVGSERLGGGDIGFAQRAALQARRLQPALPDLPAFEMRVAQAGGERP